MTVPIWLIPLIVVWLVLIFIASQIKHPEATFLCVLSGVLLTIFALFSRFLP